MKPWPIFRSVRTALFAPIPIAPLVFFRVAFGGLMLWEVWRYFEYERITRYYVEPTFLFSFWGFDWLQALPGDGMVMLFYGLGLLSILIILGAAYRLVMVLFWIAFTYVFLLDMAQYLNHFYLISLFSFLMIFIPAHRAASVDAWLRPTIRAHLVPQWSLWILRAQMSIVYCFGGLAKINPDWFAGEPLRGWMAVQTDFPVIGPMFTEEWMVGLFSAGGLLLDLCVVPLLLWPRTRLLALLAAIVFHLFNARLFNIGIFPWFAIAATLLFLPPNRFQFIPVRQPTVSSVFTTHRTRVMAALALYFVLQIALPLRHHLYPGDPSWTEEGHTFAWRMRLREKEGEITFYAGDPATGTTWALNITDHISPRQLDQMKDNPPMILQFAHHLAESLRPDYPTVRIHAHNMIALNSRTPQLLIDPTADLAQQTRDLWTADWIVPLVQDPFPNPTVPALLISRRYADTLLLINLTQESFPLDQVVLAGEGLRLQSDDWAVERLEAGECLLIQATDADTSTVFAPCNQTATITTDQIPDATTPLTLSQATTRTTCQELICVVTAPRPDPSS
jgi:vitamin K-dependent gamma-carboxylase